MDTNNRPNWSEVDAFHKDIINEYQEMPEGKRWCFLMLSIHELLDGGQFADLLETIVTIERDI